MCDAHVTEVGLVVLHARDVGLGLGVTYNEAVLVAILGDPCVGGIGGEVILALVQLISQLNAEARVVIRETGCDAELLLAFIVAVGVLEKHVVLAGCGMEIHQHLIQRIQCGALHIRGKTRLQIDARVVGDSLVVDGSEMIVGSREGVLMGLVDQYERACLGIGVRENDLGPFGVSRGVLVGGLALVAFGYVGDDGTDSSHDQRGDQDRGQNDDAKKGVSTESALLFALVHRAVTDVVEALVVALFIQICHKLPPCLLYAHPCGARVRCFL